MDRKYPENLKIETTLQLIGTMNKIGISPEKSKKRTLLHPIGTENGIGIPANNLEVIKLKHILAKNLRENSIK